MLSTKPITETVTVSQLPNTNEDREVFLLIPSDGAYVTENKNIINNLEVPIKVTLDDSMKETSVNANDTTEAAENVLFLGTDNVDFDYSVTMYPEFDSNAVGIKSNLDTKVRGIVYNNIKRTVKFVNLTVLDTYKLIDEGNSIAENITKSGMSNTSYSRDGLITTAENWNIDPTIYDLSTLSIDDGNLTGNTTFTTKAIFTNTPSIPVEGENHTLTIKRFAKDVTVNYVDEDGKVIPTVSSQIISGNIGDSYDASTDKYKLTIDGYTLDESKLPTNAKGTLSEQAQTINYVYMKEKSQMNIDKSKPTNKPNSKVSVSSVHRVLPATGEDERMIMMNVILGLILLSMEIVFSVFHFKERSK
ncbi:MucBP domain-containing protein [Enterococcus faecalis]|nr:MucBP domain-containing protein [Enterococcus faecalis]